MVECVQVGVSEGKARDILRNAGVTGFRRLSGYVALVMPLDNEPEPMPSHAECLVRWDGASISTIVCLEYILWERWLEKYGWDKKDVPYSLNYWVWNRR